MWDSVLLNKKSVSDVRSVFQHALYERMMLMGAFPVGLDLGIYT